MARGKAIKFNYDKVEDSAADLRALAGNMKDRQLKLSFSKSRGEAVTEMQSLAKELRDFGAALSELAESTAAAMDDSARQFHLAEQISEKLSERIEEAGRQWMAKR